MTRLIVTSRTVFLRFVVFTETAAYSTETLLVSNPMQRESAVVRRVFCARTRAVR